MQWDLVTRGKSEARGNLKIAKSHPQLLINENLKGCATHLGFDDTDHNFRFFLPPQMVFFFRNSDAKNAPKKFQIAHLKLFGERASSFWVLQMFLLFFLCVSAPRRKPSPEEVFMCHPHVFLFSALFSYISATNFSSKRRGAGAERSRSRRSRNRSRRRRSRFVLARIP